MTARGPRPREIWRYTCPVIGDRVGVLDAVGRATVIDGDNHLPADADPTELVGYTREYVEKLQRDRDYWRNTAGTLSGLIAKARAYGITPLEGALSGLIIRMADALAEARAEVERLTSGMSKDPWDPNGASLRYAADVLHAVIGEVEEESPEAEIIEALRWEADRADAEEEARLLYPHMTPAEQAPIAGVFLATLLARRAELNQERSDD